jgi:regulator of protease activity HflC (stomatin/prohibitin superfamily)
LSNHIPQTLLHLFFHRFDPFRSVFSTLQSQLGIDVQGARAIAFVRRSMLPLTGFLILFLWGLSSFVLVHPHEQGVRFRFGEPQEQLLNPGLHLKWPWPWGVIQTVPSSRILSMNIGHEEEEEEENGEKESILWANQHAEEEFSLLMGDQVNLISVDGTLQYQISDPILYLLSWQNPEAQFKDIAYQVLSRSCAERTLQEALSENLQILAQEVLTEIQQEATEQQLGLLPISFTFSALHPPVSVARDYQGVVSAQIDKESTLIRAHAYRLKSLPRAQIEAQTMSTTAKRDALMRVAKAKGEAEAFRGLYETVYSDRSRYLFQRRLDVLKNNLKGRRMSIIDHTLEQEGATLWIED